MMPKEITPLLSPLILRGVKKERILILGDTERQATPLIGGD
jgi:hypothetical protein